MKKKMVILGIGLTLSVAFAEEVAKTGTTAGKFLSIDVGARSVAMGGAFVAVANDASAMFWNPAGIATLSNPEVFVSYTKWLADINYNYSGFVLPLQKWGAFGLNASFLSMDAMERTTIDEPNGTGEFFDAGSLAFGLCYAKSLTDRFAIGFNGKYIRESIYHSRAQGVALDIGTLFTTPLYGMKLGMSISNFGTKMRMTGDDMLVQHDIDPMIAGNNGNISADLRTDAFDLPLLLRIGVSLDVLQGMQNNHLIVSMDALHPNDNKECLNVGCEYMYKNQIYLRAGYKSLFSPDSQQGLTLGGGIKLGISSGRKLALDYAYQDFGILTNVQRFSIGFTF